MRRWSLRRRRQSAPRRPRRSFAGPVDRNPVAVERLRSVRRSSEDATQPGELRPAERLLLPAVHRILVRATSNAKVDDAVAWVAIKSFQLFDQELDRGVEAVADGRARQENAERAGARLDDMRQRSQLRVLSASLALEGISGIVFPSMP